jgi:chromosome segregation ATPase
VSYVTKEELNNKVDKTVLDNYYTKEAIDNRGYAIASDVITALGTKVDKGSISHTDESNAEGVIVEGTELKIIVDAYTKAETLNKIQEKITEINGGESAGEVLSQLNSYIETNNTRVGNIEVKNTSQDEAITNAINLVTELENGVIASNTKDINTIKESLSVVETVTNDHKTKIKTLEDTFTTLDSVVKDHSVSIGEIAAWIEETEVETAAINEAIADMSTVLTGFGGEGEPATIKEYIDANQYTLGIASETSLGGIKAAPVTMDNGVQVSTEGIATVGRVNVNNLV